MPRIVELSFNLGLWIVTILAVLSYFLLTRVIKIEHDDFPDQWTKDGKPHGMPFWYSVKDGIGFGNSGPWSRGYRWLFKTPEWIKKHKKGLQLLNYFRYTQYGAYFVLFVMFIILFVSMLK